ncbi:MAG: hypothetical protein DDT27_01102 [Dehalococcoidia bacterium]|nr:hypothetical protein [Chloroflexota bacterium]
MLRLWAGLIPRFYVNDQGTDLERGIYNYRLICKLFIHRGNEEIYVGEGVGSCSSLEGKYRWRWLYENQLPTGIDKESLVQKRLSAKSGGSYTLYRMENSDPHDLGNTILKMAKKRSFIDGVLTVTGASRIFTQDLEEDEDGDLPKGRGKPKVKPPRAKENGDPDRQKLLLEIKAEAERIGLNPREEHDRRFPDKPPDREQLHQWLNELKEMESQPPEGPQDEPRDITALDEFFPLAMKITGKHPEQIAGMLGVKTMDDWTATLEEALDQLRRLCGKKAE